MKVEAVAGPAPSSWRRRLARGLGLLLITLVLAELAARLLFAPLTGQPFDGARLVGERQTRLADLRQRFENPADGQGLFTWHPYVGYVGRTGAHPWGAGQPPFNDFGMMDLAGTEFPSRKAPDRFVVGVLGGSVADIFANTGRDALQAALAARDPRFGDRQVQLVSLATGGYKQPQQLMHLEYALLSGFEFDAVVNIDGFNDLVLAVENRRKGLNPLYPSGYHVGLMSAASGGGLDPVAVGRLAEVWSLYRQEARVLAAAQQPVLAQSALANLLAGLWSRRSQARIGRLQYELTQAAQDQMAAVYRGPTLPASEDELAAAARSWRESSEMIGAVLEKRGIPYLHFLQPNQYVEGSKPMSEAERKLAVDPDNPWGAIARQGYGKLVAEGAALRAGGERFHDLTQLFRAEEAAVYTDNCCHFGPRGNELLAAAVAKVLVEKP